MGRLGFPKNYLQGAGSFGRLGLPEEGLVQMSHEKRAPGWLGFIGDEILSSYMGHYFINYYKDPYSTTRIQWKVHPPKTNMEPENGGPLEKEIPIGNHHFQVPCYGDSQVPCGLTAVPS